MTIPSFRTALASSAMALAIALSPAAAIVSADTPPGSTPAPQPTATTKTSETEAASTSEPAATTQPATTPAPEQSKAAATADASVSTETSPDQTQQVPPTTTQASTPTSPSLEPTNPDSQPPTNPLTAPQENHQTPPSKPVSPATLNSSSTAPVPDNHTAASPTPTSTANNSSDASIDGTITATSKSGDASVTQNTAAGDVATGDATAITNLFNLVQSSANFLNPDNELKTFTANIQGDVVGDLLLDPGQINNLATSNNSTPTGSLTVNNQANASINTTINLNAQSGNATVADNTKVGNTTTGNADAIANVVNMINSTIGAGQSFLGAINIYGNLDGDILLPPGFLDTLLASNGQTADPTNSTPNALVSQTNNQSINNTINTTAQSGNVTATDNTRLGNVTSGNSLTNLTVLNLSNSDVIGANNLLVFVNVLGKWYGVIMDAPAGTTAASLGGGITQNKSLTQAQDTTTRSESNSVINNDINVRARSGDALVTKNTIAGNATTGNATASVNLANIIGNHLSLSDWFGVLFINVFGTWNGSFGIDTVAGGTTHPNQPATSDNQQNRPSSTQPRVFKFVPNGVKSDSSSGTPYHLEPIPMGDIETSQPQQYETENVPTVLTSTITTKSEPKTILKSEPSEKKQMASWVMPVAGLTLGSLLLLGERVMAMRRKEQ